MGKSWTIIARSQFQGRSPLDVKNRWRLLVRRPTSLRPSAAARLAQHSAERNSTSHRTNHGLTTLMMPQIPETSSFSYTSTPTGIVAGAFAPSSGSLDARNIIHCFEHPAEVDANNSLSDSTHSRAVLHDPSIRGDWVLQEAELGRESHNASGSHAWLFEN